LTGEGNVAEAIALSQATFPEGSDVALIGRSDLFPDSLASGSLQGLFDAPLLLNPSDALDGAVAVELERLGAGAVFLLGGVQALSGDVAEQLQEAGYTVDRYAGPTRIETAISIADLAFAEADTAYLARAYSTSGDATQAFADSLAVGGWAADTQTPVLLTESNVLSTTTAAYLDGSAVTTVVVIGGTDALSEDAVADLEARGLEVERVFGTTRFETAVEIAEARDAAGAAAVERVILADGIGPDAWASGFAAAAHSALFDAPILLSAGEDLPATTGNWLATAPTTDLVCAPSVGDAACSAAEQQMR
jgi:putative cell wall-binding protein